ncbi:tetratricopeptide repeat protein [Undibacterium cyanobacteriorum]|uniref:protein O-GlcNAc transferase n=1 Tax=Undibacterium cyanobacteriorum TaxID=3073561 RepID=A0ABY9RP63_9BURK|nr:tetratricopeptide repeat protein [Undibacterium sp. 20NA77.5]WMW82227.1 tetratricopeptide repeat protein [Undibacterium sp. 20NA77.5]
MSKSNANPSEVLRAAQASLKFGHHQEAIQLIQGLLEKFPLHLASHKFLAKIFVDSGQSVDAVAHLQVILGLPKYEQADVAAYYACLNQMIAGRRFSDLEHASSWLSNRRPNDGIAWDFLAIAGLEQYKYPLALEAASKAIKILPENPHVLNNLGCALTSLERCAEAIEVLTKARRIAPEMANVHNNLGNAYRFIGRYEEALDCFERARQLAPNAPYIYNNLGLTYRSLDRCDSAIEVYHQALNLQPDLFQVYPNLVEAYRHSGKVRKAIEVGQTALELTQDLPELWSAYADALRDGGYLDEAIEANIRAISFKTDDESSFNRKVYTNILFCLNYHPDLDAQVIYNAYKEFDTRFAQSLMQKFKAFTHEKRVDKRLKVGYVCQSFYNQVCKYFLIPLLEKHDRSQFEIFAYAQIPFEDETTQHYKKIVDHWIPIRSMTDDEVAERIRQDGIDILIDVSGHTNSNRLLVFGQKPAPVSLHWLEYGYTTGLSAIDYFMTDAPSVEGDCDHLFSEKLWRLDGPAYVYRPDLRLADLNESPAAQSGIVTFGSLSRIVRINHRVVRIWAAILDAMPNSRLVINSGDFKDPIVQEDMANRFMQYGIARERLDIGFSSPSWEVLRKIDIGLDCFPHNSGTTLLETLFMGIPFVTLQERPSVGRIGSSVLVGAGHPEWIARTEEEYAQKALILAHDIGGLANMRRTMRQEMQKSPLMDEEAFARSVEKAFRGMWTHYCEKE